jgi:cysteine-rich repeat protein
VTACGNGIVTTAEACDDAGPSAGCDADCTAVMCGDGVANPAVACDDVGATALCDEDCTPAACGDGVVNAAAGEQCEDGNATDGDGCDSNCTLTACGNGVVTAGEECDDRGASPVCDADCTAVVCIDGVVNTAAGEQCEDGNPIDGDGCDSNCTVTRCGNGVVTPGEQCDGGGPTETCDLDCTVRVCGDGTRNAAGGEECDRGDAVEGDGCDSNCTRTACGNGIVTAGEACDDAGASPTCDVDCTLPWCGDGTHNAPAREECDDGGDSAACDIDCTVAECGDARVNPIAAETCDDGNDVAEDGCEVVCSLTPTCGNANVEVGEDCDDGDRAAGDGCSESCQAEDCADVGGEVRCLVCSAGARPDATYEACECAPGYAGVDGACLDVDECTDGSHACADPDRCVNVPGSYSCAIDCTADAFHGALASCGAPTGVITFACNDTVITLPVGGDKRLRTSHCDDLVVDGLDHGIAFEMDPPCHAIPVTAAQCAGALRADGTCACPAIDGGTGFLVLRGARNVVRNLTIRHFYEGIHAAGRDNTIESLRFERICDDAVGTIDDGVGNLFTRLTVTDGCDKCSQSFGDVALTAADPRLRGHYNAVFREVAFDGCQTPLRMTDGGRYLVERTRMTGGDDTLFGCSGPRFTAPSGQTLVVDMRDTLVEECRRGVRFGGTAQALVSKTTVVGSRLRGLLFANSSRARVWDSVIVGNGGFASSELGFGGIAAIDAARVDLGGGEVLVDGDDSPSPGRNVICNNVTLGGGRLDVQNLTAETMSALDNYWCTFEPSLRIAGPVTHEPFLDSAP